MNMTERLGNKLDEMKPDRDTAVVLLNDLEYDMCQGELGEMLNPDKELEAAGFYNFLCRGIPVMPGQVKPGSMRVTTRKEFLCHA